MRPLSTFVLSMRYLRVSVCVLFECEDVRVCVCASTRSVWLRACRVLLLGLLCVGVVPPPPPRSRDGWLRTAGRGARDARATTGVVSLMRGIHAGPSLLYRCVVG